MYDIELIFGRDKITNLVKNLLGYDYVLPDFLFSHEKYKPVVIGMKDADTYIGASYGVINNGDARFFLHFVYVKQDYRRASIVVKLLESTLSCAEKYAGASEAIWNYCAYEGRSDPRYDLLSRHTQYKVRYYNISRQVTVNTSDLGFLKKFSWYKPQRYAEIGYYILRWHECSDSMLKRIQSKEKHKEQERGYLSPYSDENEQGWKPDAVNSFVLARRGNSDPIGWIICSQLSGNGLDIRRLFVCTKERVHVVAHLFLAYFFDVVGSSHNYLCFNVEKGNRQLEAVVRRCIDPIASFSCIQCNLQIML